MANEFTWDPTIATEQAPEYANLITPSYKFKEQRLNLSSTPKRIFTLEFKHVNETIRGEILAHYVARYGGYDSFSWTSVPSYVSGASTKTCRYISYKETPVPPYSWDITCVLQEVV